MKFFKNLLYLLLSDATSKIINFVVIAYLARILLPSGLGFVHWIQTVVVIFAVAINFGLNEFGILFVSKNRTRESIEKTVNAILGFRFVAALAVYGVFIASIFVFTELRENIDYLMLGSIFFFSTVLSFDWFYTAIEDQAIPGVMRIVSKAVYLVLTVLFVESESDIIPAIIVYASSEVIFSAGLLMHYRMKLSYRISPTFRTIPSVLKEAYPLALYTANSVIISSVDIVIIGFFLAMDQVGLYSGALKIVALFVSVKYLLGQLIYPKLVKNISGTTESMNELLSVINKYFIPLGLVLMMVLYIFSSLIISAILGPEFGQSTILFRIFLISLFAEFGWIAFPYLVISHNKKIYSGIMITIGFLKIVLLFIALYLGGLQACAVAYSISTIGLFATCIFYTHKKILSVNLTGIFHVPFTTILLLSLFGYFDISNSVLIHYTVPIILTIGALFLLDGKYGITNMKKDIQYINAS